jgi:hypothetical protein
MINEKNSKNFWFGLTLFGCSLFLFCQGIWLYISYQYIFPEIYWVPPGYVPNSNWIFQMIGALVPSIGGGIIFMIVGFYLMTKKDKPKVFVGLITLSYSFILLLQTIWFLFFYPNFYPELTWYVSTNIFINSPIFFRMLGTFIPPLAGSIIFIFIGSYLIKLGMEKQQISSPEVRQTP